MDESFLEDDAGAGEVAEAEVGDGVFCDLLPETGLELQQVVVDAGPNDGEGVVLVGEGEEGFTLHVGVGNVDAVEDGREVVHDAEEVVVVAQDVLLVLSGRREVQVGGRGRRCIGGVRGEREGRYGAGKVARMGL